MKQTPSVSATHQWGPVGARGMIVLSYVFSKGPKSTLLFRTVNGQGGRALSVTGLALFGLRLPSIPSGRAVVGLLMVQAIAFALCRSREGAGVKSGRFHSAFEHKVGLCLPGFFVRFGPAVAVVAAHRSRGYRIRSRFSIPRALSFPTIRLAHL